MSRDNATTERADPVLARQVEAMAGYGVPAESIALVLGIEPSSLHCLYSHELEGGAVKANTRVAESLFRKATGDGPQSVAAAIFWLKTRAGWKEANGQEDAEAKPLTVVVRRFVIDPEDPGGSRDAPLIEAQPSNGEPQDL